MSSLFRWIAELLDKFLSLFGLGRGGDKSIKSSDMDNSEDFNLTKVFIRTNLGEKCCLELDPSWCVAQVKESLAKQFNSEDQQFKLIFAGKELPNDLLLSECDLGQNSVLHAVRIVVSKAAGDSVAHISSEATLGQSNPEKSQEKLSERTVAETIKPEKSLLPKAFEDVQKYPKVAIEESDDEDDEDSMPEQQNEDSVETSLSTKTAIPTSAALRERLLCDSSTVLTIQLTKEEQEQIKKLKSVARAHFYVFCVHPCDSVQPGKLRVRCASCKQGALTLSRDPNQWPDVLNRSVIPCACESPECAGKDTSAEFFFKCSAHLTAGEDDSAVPLYMIRANLNDAVCVSCGDTGSPIVVFECEALHVLCLDCFVTYCLSKLSERQFTHDEEFGYTLPCPVKCPDSLIREVHHFRLMGSAQYTRYQQWGAEEAVLGMGGVLCPRPGCGHGLIPDTDCDRIVCIGGCNYVFCRKCLQDYHTGDCFKTPPASGSGAIAAGLAPASGGGGFARWDVATVAAIQTTTKPCPKCQTPTERSGGCMHMECTRASCRNSWCWVCNTDWTRDCMATHWFG